MNAFRLKRNLDEAVYEQILSSIFEGKFHSGEQVQIERLCEQYEISRTPVIQALKRLATDGIVETSPTRGIDIGAKTQIYHLMRELAKQGKAIIMISSELPEVIGMSDNIVVMFEGKITGTLSGDGATQDEIMRYAENVG